MIDLKDKYINSLQYIVQMQEEMMYHKRRISEFESLSKRRYFDKLTVRKSSTFDEMIQVDVETDLTMQADATLIISSVEESGSQEDMETLDQSNNLSADGLKDQMDTESQITLQDSSVFDMIDRIAEEFTNSILEICLKEDI